MPEEHDVVETGGSEDATAPEVEEEGLEEATAPEMEKEGAEDATAPEVEDEGLEDATAPEAEDEGQPETGALVPRTRPQLGLSRAEMSWATVAHASVALTVLLGVATGGVGALLGIAIPAIIWAVYRGKSEYVADQARQATMYQLFGMAALLALAIVGALLLVVGWVVAALLTIVLVGLVLLPVMIVVTVLYVVALVALPVAQVVYGCYGAVEAFNGRPFRYRWVADLMDRDGERPLS